MKPSAGTVCRSLPRCNSFGVLPLLSGTREGQVGALTHGFSHTHRVPTTLLPGAHALGSPIL